MAPLAAALCTAASFVIRVGTGSIKVAGVFPPLAISITTATLFLASLGLSLYLLVGICLRKDGPAPELASVRNAAFAACLAAAPMLPMLSNDVFSLLAYGELALRGVDPFTSGAALSQSSYYAWVGAGWTHAPSVYGPATVLLSALSVWAGAGNLYAALAIFKLICLLASLLTVEVSYRYARAHPAVDGRTLAVVTLSPVLWLQGAGQAHSDLLAALFLLGGIVAVDRGRHRLAAALIAAAVLNKISAVFGVAFLLVHLHQAHRGDVRRLLRAVLESLAVAIVVFAVLYAPFWKGFRTLGVPLAFLADKQPSNSILMAVGEVGGWLTTALHLLGERGRSLLETVRLVGVDRSLLFVTRREVWRVATPLFLLAGLLLAVLQLAPLARRKTAGDSMGAFASIAALSLTVTSPVFQPWYLLVALPFFLHSMSRRWSVWVVLVFVISSGQNVPQITDRHSLVCVLLDPLFTYGTIALFLFAFRDRFLARPRPSLGSLTGLSALPFMRLGTDGLRATHARASHVEEVSQTEIGPAE
jgi:hypothetical protein